MSVDDFQAELVAEFGEINSAIGEFAEATWGEDLPDPTIDAQAFAVQILGASLAGIISSDPLAQGAWEQSFTLTFADIATQQPVGELSSFDRETGVGEVTVPDVAAGQIAVAATCLHWNTEATVDTITQAVAIGTAFVEANLTAPYPNFAEGDPEFPEVAQQVAPSMLGNILLLPGELWVAFFNVTDGSGPGPGPGPGPGGPGTPPAPPATPVTGDPNFTG